MNNNPANEVPKRNAVVYPVGRDHEGKQIWSVSRVGGSELNRALMVEISSQTVLSTEGSVVWETEPPLIVNDRTNPDWLAWFVTTHGVAFEEAEKEVKRRLEIFFTCRPPAPTGSKPVERRTMPDDGKVYKSPTKEKSE